MILYPQKLCEMMNTCCFKLLGLQVIFYAAINREEKKISFENSYPQLALTDICNQNSHYFVVQKTPPITDLSCSGPGMFQKQMLILSGRTHLSAKISKNLKESLRIKLTVKTHSTHKETRHCEQELRETTGSRITQSL